MGGIFITNHLVFTWVSVYSQFTCLGNLTHYLKIIIWHINEDLRLCSKPRD